MYGVEPERKRAGNGRSPRKPSRQRHRPARLPACESPGTSSLGNEPAITKEVLRHTVAACTGRSCLVSDRRTLGSKPRPWRVSAVGEWLACSHPTKESRFQSPAASPPDFSMWESCRAMPLVGGFSREFPVTPLFSFLSLQTPMLRTAQPPSFTQLMSFYLLYGSTPGMKGSGKREITEKTRRTHDIVRHDSHIRRKSGNDPTGNLARRLRFRQHRHCSYVIRVQTVKTHDEQHGDDEEKEEHEEEDGGGVHGPHAAHDDKVEDDDEQVEQSDHLHHEHARLLGGGSRVHPGEDGGAQAGADRPRDAAPARAASPGATPVHRAVELVLAAVRHQELVVPHGEILLGLLPGVCVVAVRRAAKPTTFTRGAENTRTFSEAVRYPLPSPYLSPPFFFLLPLRRHWVDETDRSSCQSSAPSCLVQFNLVTRLVYLTGCHDTDSRARSCRSFTMFNCERCGESGIGANSFNYVMQILHKVSRGWSVVWWGVAEVASAGCRLPPVPPLTGPAVAGSRTSPATMLGNRLGEDWVGIALVLLNNSRGRSPAVLCLPRVADDPRRPSLLGSDPQTTLLTLLLSQCLQLMSIRR
ncbi:hypothetical protein PR048_027338 [Dryococelus australis]|uniref:Uncharacterized protein n=1 Tax=Dryococelus australis TaxID=614101 RepID=A0ABQ9GGL6_9NEOP|nr:hypothetical protein PR048_027338 [Dryococelus australis]